jgi:alkaline phosphatase
MSISTQTAARILAGQLQGESGEEGWLSFERFPHSALVKTYSVDHQVAESGATATALLSGVKTKSAVIGVGAGTTRGDCASGRENTVTSLLELAERAGMSTGVVTTSRLTDATPAAAYAHGADRLWEADVDLPEEAARASCTDFARQLVEQQSGDGIDVALGGGRAQFLPAQEKDPADPRHRGVRDDGRDLTAEWIAKRPRSAFVWNRDQLLAQGVAETDHLLGLFAHSHMQFEADRERTPSGEPSLLEMTARALDVLERNPRGYFLLVEGGRIDHAHHGGNAYRALSDTIELSETVAMLAERTNPENTLILVTADHGHTLTISGYPRRGNPILGKVVEGKVEAKLARDGMPYATLSYANGPGAPVKAGRSDLSKVKTASTAFRQQATVPLELETHSGDDVAVFARGPMAHLIGGTVEQSYLFQVMADAARLEEPR